MRKSILILIGLIAWQSYSQGLTCDDFFNGLFIGTTPKFPGVEWKMTKHGTNQIETISKIPEKYIEQGYPTDTLFSKIHRIDKCSFRLNFDDSKMQLDQYMKRMNDNGGIFVEIKKIEGNCAFYVSKSTYESEEIVIEGKICKEK